MSDKQKVTVQSVHIRKGWSDDSKYDCTVELKSNSGKIELKLPEDRVNQIVDHVADMVVQSTTEAMQQMSLDAMSHTLIEHTPADEETSSEDEDTSSES